MILWKRYHNLCELFEKVESAVLHNNTNKSTTHTTMQRDEVLVTPAAELQGKAALERKSAVRDC